MKAAERRRPQGGGVNTWLAAAIQGGVSGSLHDITNGGFLKLCLIQHTLAKKWEEQKRARGQFLMPGDLIEQ